MPATNQDYTNIKKMQDKATGMASQAGGLIASSNTLGDSVMEAVRADRVKRGVSKLATDVGNVSGQMVSDPQGIRDRTRGVVDPNAVNSLTANARAQNLNTLGTIATQQTYNQQPIDEVINAETNRLKARASDLLAQAEAEMAKAKTIEDQYQRDFQERQFAEQQRQFNTTQAGKNGTGDQTFEGVLEVAAGQLETFMAQEPGSFNEDGSINNVNLWDRIARNIRGIYPNATDQQIADAIGVSPEVTPEYTPNPFLQNVGNFTRNAGSSAIDLIGSGANTVKESFKDTPTPGDLVVNLIDLFRKKK